MNVRIKTEACVGHAMCLLACPEVFSIDDLDGHAFVLLTEVPPSFEASVGQALNGCPEGAIEIY